ncbi:MAG: hypothetical protein KBB01_04105 [Candidatus Omnitrophica bacterium]|jgi:hypothetical protein|nr:hypothetical protein [Candidatus Omnitrophota bacterium]
MKIEHFIEKRHFASNRISTQVRAISLGLIVIIWGFLIDRSATSFITSAGEKKGLMFVGFLALLSMVLDFLQYLCIYINTNNLCNEMEKEGLETKNYDYSALSYRYANKFFWIKQLCLAIALIVFFVIVIPNFFN